MVGRRGQAVSRKLVGGLVLVAIRYSILCTIHSACGSLPLSLSLSLSLFLSRVCVCVCKFIESAHASIALSARSCNSARARKSAELTLLKPLSCRAPRGETAAKYGLLGAVTARRRTTTNSSPSDSSSETSRTSSFLALVVVNAFERGDRAAALVGVRATCASKSVSICTV